MISNIDTIKPKLYESYPKVDPALIDKLIEIYFSEAKKAIKEIKKPEIALGWGTLKINIPLAKTEVNMINSILRDNREGLTEEQLEAKKKKRDAFGNALFLLEQNKGGKTERGRDGVKRRKKRQLPNKYQQYAIESTNQKDSIEFS